MLASFLSPQDAQLGGVASRPRSNHTQLGTLMPPELGSLEPKRLFLGSQGKRLTGLVLEPKSAVLGGSAFGGVSSPGPALALYTPSAPSSENACPGSWGVVPSHSWAPV